MRWKVNSYLSSKLREGDEDLVGLLKADKDKGLEGLEIEERCGEDGGVCFWSEGRKFEWREAGLIRLIGGVICA